MQAAWRLNGPQTVSDLHLAIVAEHTAKGDRPISFPAVSKACEQLVALNFLVKEPDPRAARYAVAMTREGYVAAAMNSVSHRILGIGVADVLPMLVGRKDRSGPKKRGTPASTDALLQAINAITDESAPKPTPLGSGDD